MERPLEYVEHTVGDGADLTVVWLHGLGADGHDFAPLLPELGLRIGARFIFPHAPVRPVTINGGMRMRAWYDLYGFGPHAPEDASGLDASAALVRALLRVQLDRGVAAERIVLAGFSQGGAVALYLALTERLSPAGVVALSTYLPLAGRLATPGAAPGAAGLHVLMAHGRGDPVIPLRFAEASRDALLGLGCEVEWRAYDMGHTLCAEEVRHIAAWLESRAAGAG